MTWAYYTYQQVCSCFLGSLVLTFSSLFKLPIVSFMFILSWWPWFCTSLWKYKELEDGFHTYITSSANTQHLYLFSTFLFVYDTGTIYIPFKTISLHLCTKIHLHIFFLKHQSSNCFFILPSTIFLCEIVLIIIQPFWKNHHLKNQHKTKHSLPVTAVLLYYPFAS